MEEFKKASQEYRDKIVAEDKEDGQICPSHAMLREAFEDGAEWQVAQIQELIKELHFKGDSEIRQASINLTIEGKAEIYKKGCGAGIKMAADIIEKWAKTRR